MVLGIGAPGPIDLDRGIFRRLPNLPGWDGFDVRGSLESRHGVPVLVQNDANAADLGEAVHGAGKGYNSGMKLFFTELFRFSTSDARFLRGEEWSWT